MKKVHLLVTGLVTAAALTLTTSAAIAGPVHVDLNFGVPLPVYVQSQPAYVQSAPVYVQPGQAVVYGDPGYAGYYGNGSYYGNGAYYGNGGYYTYPGYYNNQSWREHEWREHHEGYRGNERRAYRGGWDHRGHEGDGHHGH